MSVILSSHGASSKLIDWLTGEEDYFNLLVSQPIWDEYTTVADWLIPSSRDKEKKRILKLVLSQAEWIEPLNRLNVCKDISDNRFLECAAEGRADYLATKNVRDFPPKEYNGVKIIKISRFLKILEYEKNKHIRLRQRLERSDREVL
jgi:predicted nucleic acid-binding protein